MAGGKRKNFNYFDPQPKNASLKKMALHQNFLGVSSYAVVDWVVVQIN
ncbi:MAG: hypothetical protein LBR79_04420 [Oscillospiraceae bacterium]|jgi:hypothetical protein|nr:hypothetical protein [Oscillospiraceae bacterium]